MATLFWAVCSTGGAILLFKIKDDYNEIRQEYNYIKGLKIKSPSELIKTGRKICEKNEEFTKRVDIPLNKQLITGQVFTLNPILSKIADNEKLVYRKEYGYEIYSNDRFLYSTKKQRPISWIKQEFAGFQLTKDGESCHIMKNRSVVSRLYESNLVGEKTVENPLSIFWQFISLLKLISSISSFKMKLSNRARGYKIGFTEKEYGFKVFDELIVYGEVNYCKLTDQCFVYSPIGFMKNKKQLLKSLYSKLFPLKIAMVCGGISFAISTVMLFIDLKSLLSQMITNYKNQPKKKIIITDGLMCKKCKIFPRQLEFVPCGHLIYCRNCYKSEKERSKNNLVQCPQCDMIVQSEQILYVN